VFADLGNAGPLSQGAFRTGSHAEDSSDRVIYDKASGALSYDADGSGAGTAVQFATLPTGLHLSAADFFII
jgi:Ca2+-binding RTX toxin-like protein